MLTTLCNREHHVDDPEVLHRELTEVCGSFVGAVATEPLVLARDIAVLKAINKNGIRIVVFSFDSQGRIDAFWKEGSKCYNTMFS